MTLPDLVGSEPEPEDTIRRSRSGERFCPLCEREVAAEICPVHDVPTLAHRGPLDSHEISPGMVIAKRYRIEQSLGAGAMGAVFAASQIGMSRTIALKILRPELLSEARLVKRFYREAQAVTQLNHPNIVRVFDFGIDAESGAPFLALELVRGKTLQSALEEHGPMAERRAAALLAQAARGLVEAHQKGLVHRDLKPANLMLEVLPDGEEHLRILDFGITKMCLPGPGDASELPDGPGIQPSGISAEALTAVGAVIGTPAYMSPEQALGREVDARTDLYALGCILHETLTGERPFIADSPQLLLARHIRDPAPDLPLELSAGGMPSAALRQLHRALLQKAREERPSTAREVAKAFNLIAAGTASDSIAPIGAQIGSPPPKPALTPDGEQSASELATEVAVAPAISLAQRRSPVRSIVAAGAAMGLVVAAFAMFGGFDGRGDSPRPQPGARSRSAGQLSAPGSSAPLAPMPVPVKDPRIMPHAVDRAASVGALPEPQEESRAAPTPHPRRTVLTSEPIGAEILQGTVVLGKTPFTVEARVASQPVELRLRKAGFVEKTVQLDEHAPPALSVKLRPRPKQARTGDRRGDEDIPLW